MLILTRRVGETIMVGNDVKIVILGVKGNQVRMGIEAPKDLPVHREEIYNRIAGEMRNRAIPALRKSTSCAGCMARSPAATSK